MLFADRKEAGRLLAERLEAFRNDNPIVLTLPRGGLPIGFEIARALDAPLDLVFVRKIGVPLEGELALGAIADGATPELIIDQELKNSLNVPQDYIDEAKEDALQEIERRRRVYLGNRPPMKIDGRTVIITDDGIATGSTMRAALRVTRRRDPARLILAVPVAPADTIRQLGREVDEIICLHTPRYFQAVGEFYRSFPQLRDEEVIALLEEANDKVSGTSRGHKT